MPFPNALLRVTKKMIRPFLLPCLAAAIIASLFGVLHSNSVGRQMLLGQQQSFLEYDYYDGNGGQWPQQQSYHPPSSHPISSREDRSSLLLRGTSTAVADAAAEPLPSEDTSDDKKEEKVSHNISLHVVEDNTLP